ncbi:MAG: alpha-E domain-containing protein [Sulfurimonas sp.]|nr:alpha-E domain-containing protein [Sulfurimonas sp.]MBU3939105.1 alpha-E domain-containing protein [bacterium]MBU4024501.1 alpha-E domain-containing protein [bacterium]MBU4058720.1 alpha-E domain-containing protein [bacterium]MBU4109572.1 alpha-E domain-containing protein [bacterium]
MEQLLTANVATNLYWLGRYIERTEGTLTQIMVAFDQIIDVNKNAGVELYENFSTELAYDSAQDFLNKAMFGDHSANLTAITGYARENAIISRNHLNAQAFGEIIALHALFQKSSNDLIEIDYKLIDNAHSLISEMWGEISKTEYKRISDYFLRLGQLVEKADFNFRFDENKETGIVIIEEIHKILQSLDEDKVVKVEQKQTQELDYEAIINDIHQRIESLIVN